MRKLFALALIALLALGMSLSVMNCGGAGQESTETVEAPAETPPMGDDMMADSMSTDSEMGTEEGGEGEGGH